jgi:hypothetical protein
LACGHVLTSSERTRHFRTGFRFGSGPALAVVRPGNLVEQGKVLKACSAANKAIIMQAANTGLTGGSTPGGKSARLPVYKDLSGFDFASCEGNEALVRQLHRCEFMENADNVVLVGGSSTGKSHIATALGVQAVEHRRKKVRFFGTVDLVNAPEQEHDGSSAA